MNEIVPNILKEVKFKDKKLLLGDIAHKYQFFDKQKTADILKCGDYLEFLLMQNNLTDEQKQKLMHANFCKVRFCPMCNWRRQRNLVGELKSAIELVKLERQGRQEIEYLFLTLTVKNPLMPDLKSTIMEMNKAFERMSKTKAFKAAILGGLKCLEVLGDKTKEGYAHPHFHILLLVPKRYFKGENYLSQEKFKQMWKKAMRIPENEHIEIDVRKVRPKSEDWSNEDSAIYETVKYAAKHTDILKLKDDNFKTLTEQVKGLRFLSTFGILKDKLKLQKIDEDLLNLKEEQELLWTKIAKLLYIWDNGNYYLKEIKHITKDI